MNIDELGVYLEGRPEVVWATDDDGNLYLRHSVFDKENEKLKIEPEALKELTPQKLDQVLTSGRNVEHVTRITGYFSKISGWNKGKRAELVDRHRVAVN